MEAMMNIGWFCRKVFPGKRTFISVLILLCPSLLAGTVNSYGQIISPDRQIAWDPGVPGGIPTRTTVCSNVVTNYGAYGDGVHDDTTAIQNAINACPVGQVVYIPPGIYRLNSGLTITKGIVIRGAGPAATLLKTYAVWHGIQIGDWPSSPVATNVSGSPAKGAATLTVAGITSPSLSVGDYIVIDQIDDGVEVINIDDESRNNNTRSLSQITKITGMNGLTLTIDPPLYHSYVAAQTPQVWKLNQGTTMTTYAGIEDLSIERVSPMGTEGYSNIKILASAYCWVKNIESKMAQFRHVDFDRTFRSTVRDSYFNDGMHHNIGGFAYGVVCGNRSTDNLIENNIFYHLRHSMLLHGGAGGNVYGYNYSLASYQGENWLAADMNFHGAHPHMNLFEGNIGAKIYADFTHGSSSYNTFFRNNSIRDSSAQTITNALRAVDIERVQYYHNIVGNVLGKPSQSWTAYEDGGTRTGNGSYAYTWGYASDGAVTSSDSRSKATALRHGNYDHVTQSTHWDPSIQDHNLPNSLYLTAKPTFFGSLPWPSIGPDLNPISGTIPAKERYEGRGIPAPNTLHAPTNLRIVGY
jgi:hypothetical protein